MLKKVRGLIEQGMGDGLHVGAQVCVWQGAECVADFGVGACGIKDQNPSPQADAELCEESDRPATPSAPSRSSGTACRGTVQPDSIALWMSSGKPVTAIAIAQLVEQGEIELDDEIAAFIPAFGAHGKQDITVRHLLTHTAGLRTADFRFPRDDWDTIIAAVCDREPEDGWTTGDKAGYHTQTTWFILGELVRLVDGRPIDQYVREMIIEPLKMNDSWMGMPPDVYDRYAERGRLMMMPNTAALSGGGPGLPGGKPSKSALMSRDWSTRPRPGGNCMGPIRELATFYRMLLNGGELDGARIVQPETPELFTSRQRQGMFDHTFKATVDWGLGFVINSAEHAPLDHDGKPDLTQIPYGYGPHAPRETFGHSGAQSSVAFADPRNDLAVAIVFNGMPGESKHQRRMLAVLTALYEDLGIAGAT